MLRQEHKGIFFLIVALVLTQTFVQSHHGDEEEHGEDSHHKDHSAAHSHPGHGQSVKPKFLSFTRWPVRRPKPKPSVIYVFNTELYENWTDWSECLPRDCIQVRYRKCLDDSWKEEIEDKMRASGCLSKFYAEKRTCLNTTECHRSTGEKLLNQLKETCGVQPKSNKYEAKILGGSVATPHAWPWTVRLSVRSKSGGAMSFCGGTLVTPSLVITAAHCLFSLSSDIPAGKLFKISDYTPYQLYAHIGDHHRKVKEDAQQDIRVNHAVIHPQYHRKLLTNGYDFGLLYLSQPVNISEEANLACLPPKDMKLVTGTKCVAVGWGNSKKPETSTLDTFQSILDAFLQPPPFQYPFGASPWYLSGKRRQRPKPRRQLGTLELHEVELPIIDSKKCLKHFVELNPELHICAGSKGKDTCSGDSGGGLYCRLPDSNRWVLAGVTSYGLSLGCGHNPGVYTSTEAHLGWITNNLVNPA